MSWFCLGENCRKRIPEVSSKSRLCGSIVTFGSLIFTFVVSTNLWCGRLWECVGGLGEVCKVFESELSDDVSKGRPLVPVSVLACVVMLCL